MVLHEQHYHKNGECIPYHNANLLPEHADLLPEHADLLPEHAHLLPEHERPLTRA